MMPGICCTLSREWSLGAGSAPECQVGRPIEQGHSKALEGRFRMITAMV